MLDLNVRDSKKLSVPLSPSWGTAFDGGALVAPDKNGKLAIVEPRIIVNPAYGYTEFDDLLIGTPANPPTGGSKTSAAPFGGGSVSERPADSYANNVADGIWSLNTLGGAVSSGAYMGANLGQSYGLVRPGDLRPYEITWWFCTPPSIIPAGGNDFEIIIGAASNFALSPGYFMGLYVYSAMMPNWHLIYDDGGIHTYDIGVPYAPFTRYRFRMLTIPTSTSAANVYLYLAIGGTEGMGPESLVYIYPTGSLYPAPLTSWGIPWSRIYHISGASAYPLYIDRWQATAYVNHPTLFRQSR